MKRIAAVAATAGALVVLPAHAHYTVNGNDTGGIIPWSPAVATIFRDVAADHCARYNKFAIITSVKREYGNYIGFRCLFARDYDPMKDAAFQAPYLMYQTGIVRYPVKNPPK